MRRTQVSMQGTYVFCRMLWGSHTIVTL